MKIFQWNRALFSMLFAFVNTVVLQADLMESEYVSSSPLEQGAFEERGSGEIVDKLYNDGGPIIDLEPMMVSPIITSTEQLILDMKRNPDQFLTGKGWRDNMKYRSSIDEALNLFTLPFFGLGQEQIAYMYGLDAKLQKRIDTMERIIRVNPSQSKYLKKVYMQDRYDLMRIKRQALFGSTWAVPEIGK